jgi:hypothetical protein
MAPPEVVMVIHNHMKNCSRVRMVRTSYKATDRVPGYFAEGVVMLLLEIS